MKQFSLEKLNRRSRSEELELVSYIAKFIGESNQSIKEEKKISIREDKLDLLMIQIS